MTKSNPNNDAALLRVFHVSLGTNVLIPADEISFFCNIAELQLQSMRSLTQELLRTR